MISALSIEQASLSDPPPASAIGSAVGWISDLLFGPLATTIAVIATACVGFAMLSGRANIRRGMSVVFGCFLMFGARDVALALRTVTSADTVASSGSVPSAPVYISAPPVANSANAYDPYASARLAQPR
jgi:type IV secretory pathway VirB2 component (pilin)